MIGTHTYKYSQLTLTAAKDTKRYTDYTMALAGEGLVHGPEYEEREDTPVVGRWFFRMDGMYSSTPRTLQEHADTYKWASGRGRPTVALYYVVSEREQESRRMGYPTAKFIKYHEVNISTDVALDVYNTGRGKRSKPRKERFLRGDLTEYLRRHPNNGGLSTTQYLRVSKHLSTVNLNLSSMKVDFLRQNAIDVTGTVIPCRCPDKGLCSRALLCNLRSRGSELWYHEGMAETIRGVLNADTQAMMMIREAHGLPPSPKL